MKLELLERQIGKRADKARLLGGVDHIRRIAKAGRHCRRRKRRKEGELLVFHVFAAARCTNGR